LYTIQLLETLKQKVQPVTITITELSGALCCAGKLFYLVNWLLGEIRYNLSYYFLKLQATFSLHHIPLKAK